MEYLIIKSRILDEVTVSVNRHLAEGWEIVGGVACNNYFYCQAVVKPDESFNPGWDMAPDPEINKAAWSHPNEIPSVVEKPKRSHKKKT